MLPVADTAIFIMCYKSVGIGNVRVYVCVGGGGYKGEGMGCEYKRGVLSVYREDRYRGYVCVRLFVGLRLFLLVCDRL